MLLNKKAVALALFCFGFASISAYASSSISTTIGVAGTINFTASLTMPTCSVDSQGGSAINSTISLGNDINPATLPTVPSPSGAYTKEFSLSVSNCYRGVIFGFGTMNPISADRTQASFSAPPTIVQPGESFTPVDGSLNLALYDANTGGAPTPILFSNMPDLLNVAFQPLANGKATFKYIASLVKVGQNLPTGAVSLPVIVYMAYQ